MKRAVILNPNAGKVLGKTTVPIQALFKKMEGESFFFFTEANGHAIELAKEVAQKDFEQIIAIGGDGTNHEVLNGLIQQDFFSQNNHPVPYALLPIGSGNDWARYYKIPTDFKQWAKLLQSGQSRTQDIGLLTYQDNDQTTHQRYFFNVAGLAYDAYVVDLLEKEGNTKKSGLIYLLKLMQYLFNYQPSKARLHFNDKTIEGLFYTINAGICPYSGGGMRLVPHAIPNDGRLALTYAEDIPKWNILLSTWRFYNGSLLKHKRVHGTQCKKIKIESLDNRDVLLEADGEILGAAPVTIEIIPEAIRFACPG